MSTENEYNFRNLAITNIGCDEARKIMDFFIIAWFKETPKSLASGRN